MMSSNGTRQFSPTTDHPNAPGPAGVEGAAYRQNNSSLRRQPPVPGPKPQYPSINIGSLETHEQPYLREINNDTRYGSYATASRSDQSGGLSSPSEQYRAYDKSQYAASSFDPSSTAKHQANTYQHRSSPSFGSTQDYPTQTFTPISRKAIPYPPTPSPGHAFQNSSTMAQERGVRHAPAPSQKNISPYHTPPADAMMTPDRSVIGSPLPQMTPDSLQRELEKTKDYAENILTKLIDTTNLLKERDVEIAQLHDRLTTSGSSRGYPQHQGGSSWEVDGLRHKLHEHSQALQAAQDHARYQQGQAELWARENSQLRDSQRQQQQQQPPQVNHAQMEEARKVTDFYKQKVDQLSRDNMNITQQNRKLTEDLAAAQRDVRQQRSRLV